MLVGNRKSAELFAADSRISHLEADYPRIRPQSATASNSPTTSAARSKGPNRIVVDPDSRMTQLGLIPVCEPEHYFHFPSRTADSAAKSHRTDTKLASRNIRRIGQRVYRAASRSPSKAIAPRATVSLGVGDNETKRIHGDFEAQLIRALGETFRTIWIDRGVGGEEALRVTAAAEASGCIDRIRFWEGSFAGFASLIAQSDLYAGYDSAGQHAAAASGTPLITIFAGAPSERFRQRWSPRGPGRIRVIEADSLTPDACLQQLLTAD